MSTRMVLAYSGIFTFLVDAYPQFAASALAANSFARSSFAGVFPLFGRQSKFGIMLCNLPPAGHPASPENYQADGSYHHSVRILGNPMGNVPVGLPHVDHDSIPVSFLYTFSLFVILSFASLTLFLSCASDIYFSSTANRFVRRVALLLR